MKNFQNLPDISACMRELVKDRIIKFILKTIMLEWIFICQVCMFGEILYGKSTILAFVYFLFGIQGLKWYLDAR